MDFKEFVKDTELLLFCNSFNHSFTVHRGVCLSGSQE